MSCLSLPSVCSFLHKFHSSCSLQLWQHHCLKLFQSKFAILANFLHSYVANFQVVNDQQRELVRAQGAYTQSFFDYMLALAQLEQAMGEGVPYEAPFFPEDTTSSEE